MNEGEQAVKKFCMMLTWIFLVGNNASAEVYKWIDENGKVQFSDKAPPAKNAEDISRDVEKTNVDHASGRMAAATSGRHEKTDEEKQLEKDREQKQIEQLEATIGDGCRRMKKDIDAIARGERVAFIDKDGKEVMVPQRDLGKKLEEWKVGYENAGCNKLIPLE